MRRRNLFILAGITIAVVATAVAVSVLRAPRQFAERELLFPKLGKNINDVAGIRVEGLGRTITLRRSGDTWGIEEADGYPALSERVKQVVVGVADLRIDSTKTSNPELYKRLGVENPSAKGASSMRLDLADASSKPLASLIAGSPRRSAAPGGQPGLYVRLPGNAQALLVNGRLNPSTELSDWIERDLFDIAAPRVREIRIQHADGTVLRVARPQPGADLAVPDLPKGKDLQSDVVASRLGTVLEGFFAEGVRGASRVTFPENATTVTVNTFDGLTANISAARIDDQPFALFAFSYDTPPAAAAPATGAETKQADVAAEAQRIQNTVMGWAFQIPQFKFDLLNQRLEDLIRVAPKQGAAPANAEDQPLPE